MDELSKEYVISFFERSLMLHGDRPEAVRWTAGGQTAHYRSMLDIGDLSGTKILDYGCGTGGLYGWLRDQGIPVDYTGYDINPKLIEAARKKYPEARFGVLDAEETDLGEMFDYILLCGVFNLRVQGVEDTVRKTVARLFKQCRIGLGYNGLSAFEPKQDFELYYCRPDELLAFAIREISPHVVLRHDRMRYDFCLFIYRQANAFETRKNEDAL